MSNLVQRVSTWTLSLFLLACGHESPSSTSCELTLPTGSFTAQGTIGGAAVKATTVISGSEGAPGLTSTQILVSPASCLCDVAKHSRDDSPLQLRDDLLWIEVTEPCGDAGSFCFQEPSAPGVFIVRPTDVAAKIAVARFDRCGGDAEVSIDATAGQVTVTAASSSGIRGTFDLTFSNGEHLTGSFDAPRCAEMGYHFGVTVDCR
jgi:hypothetical protein